MSLAAILQVVRDQEKTLRLPETASADLLEELRARIGTRNVRIERAQRPGTDRRSSVVLSKGEKTLVEFELEALRQYVDGGMRTPTATSDPGAIRALTEQLKETTFTSVDFDQMVQSSIEIEERAWRVGSGTVCAGFQQLSRFSDSADRYRRLTDRGLDVHVWGVPDERLTASQFTVHGVNTDEVRRHWFVVFDGGDNPDQRSALLARETGNRTFDGILTYDPGIVDGILDHLHRQYPTGRFRN